MFKIFALVKNECAGPIAINAPHIYLAGFILINYSFLWKTQFKVIIVDCVQIISLSEIEKKHKKGKIVKRKK